MEVTIKCIFGVEERTNSETGNKERYIYTKSVSLNRSVPFSFWLEVYIAYDDNKSDIECVLEGYDWRYISGNTLLTASDSTSGSNSTRPSVTQTYLNGSYGGYGFAGVCFVDENIKVGPGAAGNNLDYEFETEADITYNDIIYRFSTYNNIGVY